MCRPCRGQPRCPALLTPGPRHVAPGLRCPVPVARVTRFADSAGTASRGLPGSSVLRGRLETDEAPALGNQALLVPAMLDNVALSHMGTSPCLIDRSDGFEPCFSSLSRAALGLGSRPRSRARAVGRALAACALRRGDAGAAVGSPGRPVLLPVPAPCPCSRPRRCCSLPLLRGEPRLALSPWHGPGSRGGAGAERGPSSCSAPLPHHVPSMSWWLLPLALQTDPVLRLCPALRGCW